MEPRMKNPAAVLPGGWQAVAALAEITKTGGVPAPTLALVHLRASQINGCSACVDGGVKSATKAGETAERLATVAAWREAPYFSDAERAALALTEAATAPTRCRTRSGTKPPGTTTSRAWPHSSWPSRSSTSSTA
jgi:AhpD family alkylhydroperoxidase